MKKIIIAAIALTMTALPVFASSKAGTVTVAKGSADVVKTNAVMGKMVKNGTDLMFDDILRTKRKGYAEVNFVDGSLIKIFEKSRLLLNGADRTKDGYNAEIQKGKVVFKIEKMYDVPGDFRIKTTNSIIGVKGTTIGVMTTPTMGTTVEVYAGVVQMFSVPPVLLPAGNVGALYSGPPPATGLINEPSGSLVTLTSGQGATISSGGVITTFSIGGTSQLFGVGGFNGQSSFGSGQPNPQSSGSAPAPTEAQIFSGMGSDEAAAADTPDTGTGLGAGDAGAGGLTGGLVTVETPVVVPTVDTGAGAAASSIGQVQSASSDIYNSANRPSTPEQVQQSLGNVNIHIHFK